MAERATTRSSALRSPTPKRSARAGGARVGVGRRACAVGGGARRSGRLFATADGARSLEAQLREIMGAQRALGEEAAAAAEADEADETSVSVKLDALSASAVRLSVDYDGADGLGPPPAAPPPPP